MSNAHSQKNVYAVPSKQLQVKNRLKQIFEQHTNYESMSKYTEDIFGFLNSEKEKLLQIYTNANLEFSEPVSVSSDSENKLITLQRGIDRFEIEYTGNWNYLICTRSVTDEVSHTEFFRYSSTVSNRQEQLAMDWPAPEFKKEPVDLINAFQNSSIIETLTSLPNSESREKKLIVPRSRLNKLIIELYCGNQYAPQELKSLFEIIIDSSVTVDFAKEHPEKSET